MILGYAYAGAYKTRVAYDWSAELTVYVDQEKKAKGVGTQLYQGLENCLRQQNVVNAVACITAGNEQSEKFHQKLGYQQVASFPHIGYKFDQWHDVLWLQKNLATLEEVAPFRPFSMIEHQF